MELIYFTEEFFGELANFIPVVLIVPVAILSLILIDRRRPLSSAVFSAGLSSLLSTIAVFGAFLLASNQSSELLLAVAESSLFLVGIGITAPLVFIPVWLFARFWISRRMLARVSESFE